MGFDIYGKSGNYFRNNVWGWRPLWNFVCDKCFDILDEKDKNRGSFNDGHFINKEKAHKIAIRLKISLISGEVKQYKKNYYDKLKRLPLQICFTCSGTGIINNKHHKGKCTGCGGSGKRKDFDTYYPFNISNVREFIKFCENSKGFSIS